MTLLSTELEPLSAQSSYKLPPASRRVVINGSFIHIQEYFYLLSFLRRKVDINLIISVRRRNLALSSVSLLGNHG